ncbi:hypothetical protein ACERIM_05460 [Natrinema sp. H-ect1]|uniref:hypothetical protein n=1 Tax=Natrinema sp. H-ect1 TaxID=3242700 RepID=UPI00359EC1D2
MDRGIRRRLDVLIALNASLLGIVLTIVFFSERITIFVLVLSVFVAVGIGLASLWYAEG